MSRPSIETHNLEVLYLNSTSESFMIIKLSKMVYKVWNLQLALVLYYYLQVASCISCIYITEYTLYNHRCLSVSNTYQNFKVLSGVLKICIHLSLGVKSAKNVSKKLKIGTILYKWTKRGVLLTIGLNDLRTLFPKHPTSIYINWPIF